MKPKRNAQRGTPKQTAQVRIWDPLVRCLHWSLAAAFGVAYLTRSDGYDQHIVAGYGVAGLVAIRIIWGFAGPRHARFADFVRGPAAVVAYLRGLLRRTPPRYLGHNPAGGAMVVALLASLAAIAVSGVAFDAAENRAGPLGDTALFLYRDGIAMLHTVATNAALALVTVHVLGVVATSLIHGDNLIVAMITGNKRANPTGVDG